jgi:hypothetical protein
MRTHFHSTFKQISRSCGLFLRNWRLSLHARGFGIVSSARVVVRYAPELELELDLLLPYALQRYHRELVDLTQQFGMELPVPVTVFLVRSPRDIETLFHIDRGGVALPECNAIVLAAGSNDRETIRHEFAHLFSAAWNPSAPPLLSEGLSVWLQESDGRASVESDAKSALWDGSLTLNRLLTEESLFRAGEYCHEAYMLAGSFTDFLIRHYAWNRYRTFYSGACAIDFCREFRACFSIDLNLAEGMWRDEGIARWS